MSNPLTDIVPVRYRVKVYAVLSLLLLVWTVVQAAGGDWREVVGGLLLALTTGTAASNPTAE